MPAPNQPSVFYFPVEMQNTAPKFREMWQCIVMLEFTVGFVAAWWHEAAQGQRGWIVPLETVYWLQ